MTYNQRTQKPSVRYLNSPSGFDTCVQTARGIFTWLVQWRMIHVCLCMYERTHMHKHLQKTWCLQSKLQGPGQKLLAFAS